MEQSIGLRPASVQYPRYKSVTSTVKLRGNYVKIHALCTGMVAVKENFQTKKGFGALAKLNILIGQTYTDYLPIWVWVIEHPDGLIVIDTGANSASNDIDKHLSNESWFLRYQFRHAARFSVNQEDELDHQFDKINLRQDDVRLVILTHLHLDHTDGIRNFPKSEIIIGDYEFNHPENNMSSTYPSWFKPNRVKYKTDKIEHFNYACSLTNMEDLLYVPTPGHTKGHSSVIFKTDDFDIVFAGDTSYNQEQVLSGQLAGANSDFKSSKETYKKLLSYASNRPTIYLPSHDKDAAVRLKQREFLITHPLK